MMKKSIIFLLILTLVVSTFLVGCTKTDEPDDPVDTGEETPDVDQEEDEGEDVAGRPSEPMGQITIGDTTELTGDWVPYWQNAASDYNIYNFITGYGTVDMTFEGEYLLNETIVTNYETTENDDGSKTFEFTIREDLVYHDGTPITAKDYVASVALWSSKQVAELGAKNNAGQYFVGWGPFSKGETKVFEGVRLLDDYVFSVTMAAEHLPYFYELANVGVGPENLAYWTNEDVDILDDGDGVYFTDNFIAEDFKDHMNAQRVGSYPSTGAYVLKDYDEASKTAVLEVNPTYIGDYTGQKPSIKTVIYKKVNQATALDELATGQVDLLSKLASGDEINAGLDLVDDGGFDYTSYPRAGYGKVVLSCDFGPTGDVEVRQALTHLLDRNEFARAFTGGHGSVVDGPYGESMWFYQESRAELNEKLNQYPYSLDNAVALLEEAGWVLDKDGNEYKEGLRYKKMDDGTIAPLILEWASTVDNAVSELLVIQLQENPDVKAAGMQINQTLMEFEELLNYLYRDGSQDPKYGIPEFHMFNLASNFTPVYDLSDTYTTDPAMLAAGGYNTNFIIDKELEGLAKEMVLKDAEDREGFKKTFVDFIERWNYLAPDIALYSNIYYDVYHEKLQDYEINPLVRVDKAILYSYVTE